MKIEKQKIIELLKSKPMAIAILEELNAIQELPKSGLVAGQAVSSLVTELLGLNINPVVNDIDIFYIYTDNFAIEKVMRHFKDSELDNEMSSSNKIVVSTDIYSHITSMHTYTSYHMVGTSRNKKINNVWVKFNGTFFKYELISLQRELVSNFDINSTQIGIDIETKEIIFSENFINFLLTRQLDIVYWNTPVHSLIRLLKKQKELGVYCDIEKNKMLVSTLQTAYKHSLFACLKEKHEIKSREIPYLNHSTQIFLHEMKSVSLFFGSKMKGNYDLFKNQLSEFDLLNRVSEDTKTNEGQISWLSEIKTNELWTLSEKSDNHIEKFLSVFNRQDILSLDRYFKFNEVYENMFKGEVAGINKNINTTYSSTMAYIKSIPTIHKVLTTTRQNIRHFVKGGDFGEENNLFKSFFASKISGLENFHKIPEKDWILLKRMYTKHASVISNLVERSSVTETMRVINLLHKLEKIYGEMVYGALESKYIPAELIQEESLIGLINYTIKIKTEPLKERLIDYVGEFGSAKELISGLEIGREGSEMGHCVGGYANKILYMGSIIIACKNSNNERFTIELMKVKDKYQIIQVQKRFNKPTRFKECANLLKIINNSYSIFPMNKTSKAAFKRSRGINFGEYNAREEELPF